MAAENPQEIPQGIKATLAPDGKTVLLTTPDGAEMYVPRLRTKNKDRLSPTANHALSVMQLAVKLAFPEETTGSGDFEASVERESEITSIPNRRVMHETEALQWAGPVLAASGYSAREVADVLINEYGGFRTARELGSLGRLQIEKMKNTLTGKISEFYPGEQNVSIKRRRRLHRSTA